MSELKPTACPLDEHLIVEKNFFFLEYAGELRIIVLWRENKGPSTLPTHAGTIHEKVGTLTTLSPIRHLTTDNQAQAPNQRSLPHLTKVLGAS